MKTQILLVHDGRKVFKYSFVTTTGLKKLTWKDISS